ncbi:MAG TPA: site-2 protease family protein [Candidatus Limnocylindrales bacterium]|nr:site-2 protease family protein [Candidatus Limnocylindrales bacterium]
MHAQEMERLAAQARSLEAGKNLPEAHERWQSVLPLLPPESSQAQWIRGHLREIESAIRSPRQQNATKQWAKRLGPLGPLAIILAKAKTFLFAIFKLKFLFSFAAFFGLYWGIWGARFGIGFALLILVHEMGHYVEIKRRGLPADMPVFLPGLGAYVRWQAMGVSLETRAAVSLAGPLAGFLGSAACALVAFKTRDPIWAALARSGAWLNVLNLVPVWVLDGAGGIMPLNAMEKTLVAMASAGLGYATHEPVFYFVAAGTLFNLILMRRPAQNTMIRLGIDGPGEAAATGAAYGPPQESHYQGSPVMAAYFVAVLTALGALLYLVPGHGMGLP